jgi:branched-chain amino acid transport system substrate-binding protein
VVSDRSPHRSDDGRLTRREVLRRFGVYGAAIAAGPAVLAACGGDDGGTSATTTTATGGSVTSAGSAGGTVKAATVADLPKLLGIGADTGKGMSQNWASVLALTGSGSFYGKTMTNGLNLAVDHIKAAGGPDIKVDYYDHKSGDAQAGKDAGTAIGAKGTPVSLPSYGAVLGAMLPAIEQYKVFSLDGGGGTGIFAQGKPYFWGTRAITPNDTFAGLFKYIKQTSPNAKTVGLAGWDIGEPGNSETKADVLKQIEANGYQFNGLYELVPIGNLDYSALFPKIKANEPDVLFLGLYGQDPGAFVNQSITAGLKATVFGFEFTPDGVNASKGAYDSHGWTFAYDYFDAANPTNPMGALFVDEFKKKYGEDPDFYAANYYENGLRVWLMISRVLKKGGNINDGAQLDAALQSNLELPSVYGGDASGPGTDELDPTTHSVKRRQMGVFEYKAKKVKPLAFFNIGGADFKMA